MIRIAKALIRVRCSLGFHSWSTSQDFLRWYYHDVCQWCGTSFDVSGEEAMEAERSR